MPPGGNFCFSSCTIMAVTVESRTCVTCINHLNGRRNAPASSVRENKSRTNGILRKVSNGASIVAARCVVRGKGQGDHGGTD